MRVHIYAFWTDYKPVYKKPSAQRWLKNDKAKTPPYLD